MWLMLLDTCHMVNAQLKKCNGIRAFLEVCYTSHNHTCTHTGLCVGSGFCTCSVLPHFALCCCLQKAGWEVKGLFLTSPATQGLNPAQESQVQRGGGLSPGQGSQSLAEGKDGVQGGWSGVWQAVSGLQRLEAVGRVPSFRTRPLSCQRLHPGLHIGILALPLPAPWPSTSHRHLLLASGGGLLEAWRDFCLTG